MNVIQINDDLLCKYYELEQYWSKSNEVIIEINISEPKLKNCVLSLLSKLSSEFANEVLAEIVEKYEIDEYLMSEIFKNGNVGCKVSVCLKHNLPESIQQLCRNSENLDVIEHFKQKYKI